MLAEDPGDIEALEALSRLAETDGRWPELGELLATRRDGQQVSFLVPAEAARALVEQRSHLLGQCGQSVAGAQSRGLLV